MNEINEMDQLDQTNQMNQPLVAQSRSSRRLPHRPPSALRTPQFTIHH